MLRPGVWISQQSIVSSIIRHVLPSRRNDVLQSAHFSYPRLYTPSSLNITFLGCSRSPARGNVNDSPDQIWFSSFLSFSFVRGHVEDMPGDKLIVSLSLSSFHRFQELRNCMSTGADEPLERKPKVQVWYWLGPKREQHLRRFCLFSGETREASRTSLWTATICAPCESECRLPEGWRRWSDRSYLFSTFERSWLWRIQNYLNISHYFLWFYYYYYYYYYSSFMSSKRRRRSLPGLRRWLKKQIWIFRKRRRSDPRRDNTLRNSECYLRTTLLD